MTIETETLPRPRIEAEALPAPRLPAEVAVIQPAALPGRGPGTITLALSGVGVLAVGLAALATGNFVAAQFTRGAALGWLTLAVAGLGFGLLGAGIWRELRGLLGLHRVDRLRAALAGGDLAQARAAARAWLTRLPEHDGVLPAIEAAGEVGAVVALLRAGPVAGLRAGTDALSRNAALQVFAATAAIPSPSLDGLLFAWRGLRLVRQVAELHGVRPGLLGTLALLRRTAMSAALVTAADLAANTAAHALLSNPILEHLAGDTAAAMVAARRMTLLARAAAAACSPVPPV